MGRGSDSPNAVSMIETLSRRVAREANHDWVGVEHLLVALSQPECPGHTAAVLSSLGLDSRSLSHGLANCFGEPFTPRQNSDPDTFPLSPRYTATIRLAERYAREESRTSTSEDVLLALCRTWNSAPLLAKVSGLHSGAVRILAKLEGYSLSDDDYEEGRDHKTWPPIPLSPGPDGVDPRRRGPWSRRAFLTLNSSTAVRADGRTLGYIVDRDGIPIRTVRGQLIDEVSHPDGSLARDLWGRPIVQEVDLPEGGRMARPDI